MKIVTTFLILLINLLFCKINTNNYNNNLKINLFPSFYSAVQSLKYKAAFFSIDIEYERTIKNKRISIAPNFLLDYTPPDVHQFVLLIINPSVAIRFYLLKKYNNKGIFVGVKPGWLFNNNLEYKEKYHLLSVSGIFGYKFYFKRFLLELGTGIGIIILLNKSQDQRVGIYDRDVIVLNVGFLF